MGGLLWQKTEFWASQNAAQASAAGLLNKGRQAQEYCWSTHAFIALQLMDWTSLLVIAAALPADA